MAEGKTQSPTLKYEEEKGDKNYDGQKIGEEEVKTEQEKGEKVTQKEAKEEKLAEKEEKEAEAPAPPCAKEDSHSSFSSCEGSHSLTQPQINIYSSSPPSPSPASFSHPSPSSPRPSHLSASVVSVQRTEQICDGCAVDSLPYAVPIATTNIHTNRNGLPLPTPHFPSTVHMDNSCSYTPHFDTQTQQFFTQPQFYWTDMSSGIGKKCLNGNVYGYGVYPSTQPTKQKVPEGILDNTAEKKNKNNEENSEDNKNDYKNSMLYFNPKDYGYSNTSGGMDPRQGYALVYPYVPLNMHKKNKLYKHNSSSCNHGGNDGTSVHAGEGIDNTINSNASKINKIKPQKRTMCC